VWVDGPRQACTAPEHGVLDTLQTVGDQLPGDIKIRVTP
jgi:hypothetical protein